MMIMNDFMILPGDDQSSSATNHADAAASKDNFSSHHDISKKGRIELDDGLKNSSVLSNVEENVTVAEYNAMTVLQSVREDENAESLPSLGTNELIIKLAAEATSLNTNMEYLRSSLLPRYKKDLEEAERELNILKDNSYLDKAKLSKLEEHVLNLRKEMVRVESSLKQQVSFCSYIGAILGNFLWKASRYPKVIELILTGNRFNEFLRMVKDSLEAFSEILKDAPPNYKTHKMEYMVTIFGIISNLAGSSDGRDILVNDCDGSALILQMAKTLYVIPDHSGNVLKRLALMALFNASLNKIGATMLRKEEKLFVWIRKTLTDETPVSDIFDLTLKLFQSLTYDIEEHHFYQYLTTLFPPEFFEELMKSQHIEKGSIEKIQEVNGYFQQARVKFLLHA